MGVMHETRVKGLEARMIRAEENVDGLTDIVYETRRELAQHGLILEMFVDHFGMVAGPCQADRHYRIPPDPLAPHRSGRPSRPAMGGHRAQGPASRKARPASASCGAEPARRLP